MMINFPADVYETVVSWSLPCKRDTPGDDEARNLLLGRIGAADMAITMYLLTLWQGGVKNG